jgi:hypothetical protein
MPVPRQARVVTGGDVSPSGSTFLASEADVAPARRSRARMGAVIVAVLGLSVGAAVAFTVLRGPRTAAAGTGIVAPSTTSATTGAGTATVTATATATTVAEVPIPEVELRIEGAPKDAVVKDGARELGVAPGPFKLKSGAPVTLTVSAKGFKPKDVQVTPTSSSTLRVVLERQGGRATPTGQPINKDLEGF